MARRPDLETASRVLVQRLVPSACLALALSLGSVACTKAPQKPPESALKQAQKDERIQAEEDLDPERRHLAPPPAYGNKVVMARTTNAHSTEF